MAYPTSAPLRLALEKVDFLPPTRVTDDASILTLKALVFEPLLRWENGLARPGLFDRYAHDGTGRRWRFHIRDDAQFHDGAICRPQHVLDFISAILDSVDTFGMKWSYARYLANVRFTCESDNIVGMETPEPFADILDIFSEFYLCRVGADGRPTLGTGRFRVIDFTPGVAAHLQRVSPGSGPHDILVRAIPDADERWRQLNAGAVDAAHNLERMHALPERSPDLTWGEAANTLSVIFYLNCLEGLFRNPDARLAINHAIDRIRIIDTLFHGLAIPAASIVSPFHLGMAGQELPSHSFDPDLARALFDKAGAPSRIKLRTPRTMPERAREVSECVADDLARIGITTDIEIVEDRPDYARQVSRREIGDMAIFDSSPHSTFRILDDKISSRTRALWWQGFDDPETERLFALARQAVDDSGRASAYAACLRRLHAQPPWLYLYHPVVVYAARPGSGHLHVDHMGILNIA